MANRQRFLSKVIVRNLPIGLEEVAFRELVGENVLSSVDYFYYVPGKARSKASDVLTKAYLNFTTETALLGFKNKIDGHTFLDSKGSSLSCSVEYAQSQLRPRKAGGAGPKQNVKPDAAVGTIEDDEHYKQFLADLAAPVASSAADSEVSASSSARQLTPLLLAIKQKDQQKFAEKMKAKKKKSKKSAAKPSAAKPTAAASAPSTQPATSKRKKQKKKKPTQAQAQAGGPKFGTVKILSAASGAPQTAAPASPSAAPVASPANAEAKKKRQRRPKPKKTAGATPAPGTPKKVQTAS